MLLPCMIMLHNAMASPTPQEGVQRVVSSAAGLRLMPQPAVEWRHGSCPSAASVEVLHNERRQTMEGFGASMTEAGAMNLNSLPEAAQSELLELLFGSSGARLTALKTTMLCNDFSTQAPWSTYDDVLGDVRLLNFSINRDLRPNGTLPYLKRALAVGSNITLQAYMDFPPDWMLIGQAPRLAVLNPKYYAALAAYFARYIEAYAAQGVHIDFLEAFNEPSDSCALLCTRSATHAACCATTRCAATWRCHVECRPALRYIALRRHGPCDLVRPCVCLAIPAYPCRQQLLTVWFGVRAPCC